jgi:hypothetical protein
MDENVSSPHIHGDAMPIVDVRTPSNAFEADGLAHLVR